MNPIQFECPHCQTIITGDESHYGQRVKCGKCQEPLLVPPAPANPGPQTARLISQAPASQESDIFKLSPVARAFPGQILLGLIFVGLAIALGMRASDLSWPRWVAWVPLAVGALLLLVVWFRVKSCRYRLTTQRLLVQRGWWAKHLNELELYRVKDVVVHQGFLSRLLGYGTITVLSDDDSTPAVALAGIAGPIIVKEMIRTQYRAARQREGVHPTEFLRSS